jgi:hypothetical protein
MRNGLRASRNSPGQLVHPIRTLMTQDQNGVQSVACQQRETGHRQREESLAEPPSRRLRPGRIMSTRPASAPPRSPCPAYELPTPTWVATRVRNPMYPSPSAYRTISCTCYGVRDTVHLNSLRALRWERGSASKPSVTGLKPKWDELHSRTLLILIWIYFLVLNEQCESIQDAEKVWEGEKRGESLVYGHGKPTGARTEPLLTLYACSGRRSWKAEQNSRQINKNC